MSFVALSSVLFSLGTSMIAIYAELSKTTPISSKHSMIRGIICICCVIFIGFAIGNSYVPSVLHMVVTFFIFSVSCLQCYIEMSGKSLNKIIEDLDVLIEKHQEISK